MEFLIIQDFENYPAIEHDFERNLFNEQSHLKSRSENGWLYFLLKNQEEILARTVFKILDKEAVNPFRSTFGGIEFSNKLSAFDLNDFVKKIIIHLKLVGVNAVSIILPPQFIDESKIKLLEEILQKNHFLVAFKDLNQHLVINNNSFESKIIPAQKRRLRKCTKANFDFNILDLNYLDEYFELLVASRTRKNYPLSLDKNAVEKLLIGFPTAFHLMGVLDNKKLIAASILVKVSGRVLYYFLPADHVDYLTFSPMVMLLAKIYEYCQINHFEYFDLGISSVNGRFPFGLNLANFKENCGAIASDKRAFRLQIIEHC